MRIDIPKTLTIKIKVIYYINSQNKLFVSKIKKKILRKQFQKGIIIMPQLFKLCIFCTFLNLVI